jgi:hypothetical protein
MHEAAAMASCTRPDEKETFLDVQRRPSRPYLLTSCLAPAVTLMAMGETMAARVLRI